MANSRELRDIRLACLKLAKPESMSNADDAGRIVARARLFESYVLEGQESAADNPEGPAARRRTARHADTVQTPAKRSE